MKSSKSLKENVPPSTGKSKLPRKIASKPKLGASMPPSQVKKKYAGIVPSNSPKRILGELPREQKKIVKVRKLQQEITAKEEKIKQEKEEEKAEEEFEQDSSALQSILDETGIEGIPSQKLVPQRHTLAVSTTTKPARQSLFSGMRRETGIKNFERICDDFIRRTSMMPPQAKQQCVEKTDNPKSPKTPARNPFHASQSPFHNSPFTPRPSIGPARIRVEKSMFGLDVKGSPVSATCNTPVRTPVQKEVLSFTAQRILKTDSKGTPQPMRLAVTSVKKKKHLTWADALEDCCSPEFRRRISGDITKGKKSLFCGQGDASESDSISRKPCDPIASSSIKEDESHAGTTSEKPRVTRQVEGKQHEMQRDQNQESRTTPFLPSHDTAQLPVDIRTLATATEKIVQIQDNAQSRPTSGNLGGLSHNLSTAVSVDDSQQPVHTMTQLSKFTGQGQEKLSKCSQQGHGIAKISAGTAGLEKVQEIPSRESQMFIKYVKQDTSAQTFSGFSYDISQSQTKSSIKLDNSEAMQTLYDSSESSKQLLTPELLDSQQKTLECTEVDDNGNIKVVTTLAEPGFGENKNDLFRQATANVSSASSFAATFSQGTTQAAAYAEDTKNKNENLESSEAKLATNENWNKTVSKCDVTVKRKMIAPLIYEPDDVNELEGMSTILGEPLWTPKQESVCDQLINPNLRVEGNGNQASAFSSELPYTGRSLHQERTDFVDKDSLLPDTKRVYQLPVSEALQTLCEPKPICQQRVGQSQQMISSCRVDPPLMTPLAMRDIARKHGGSSFPPPIKTEIVSESQNLSMKACTGQEDLKPIGQDFSPCTEIDTYGAIDLSKSAKKKRQEKPKITGSCYSSGTSPSHRARPGPYSPRPNVYGSAFQPIRPSRLSHRIGSLSLYGNTDGVECPGHGRCYNGNNELFLQGASDRFQEALLDEEVARYFRLGLLDVISPPRLCDNPIAKTLLEGDGMHFIPICEEMRMCVDDDKHDRHFEDSAFTIVPTDHRST